MYKSLLNFYLSNDKKILFRPIILIKFRLIKFALIKFALIKALFKMTSFKNNQV